jgi:hypothetical protein
MADIIFASEGVSDLRVIEVDHPLGGIAAADLGQRIEVASELALEILRNEP